jgi:hypothetical protein
MAVIETMTFRLVEGADVEAFLRADKRLQSAFAYQQTGLVRRTTARGEGSAAGEWIVIDLWRSAEDTDRAAARWEEDESARAFMSLVDPGSVRVRRYTDLD